MEKDQLPEEIRSYCHNWACQAVNNYNDTAAALLANFVGVDLINKQFIGEETLCHYACKYDCYKLL